MMRRVAWWFVALLPLCAALVWASFSAPVPEPLAARAALGDLAPAWSFDDWYRFDGTPSHAFARLLHLGALAIPGATVASVVWVQVVLVWLLVATLFSVVRRAFPDVLSLRSHAGHCANALLFALLGLFAASPAYGANWLHGERVGVFAVPVCFVAALSLLQCEGRLGWRAVLALLLVVVATLSHANGIAVFLALVPALLAAARRRGVGSGAIAWLGALLIIGNVAAWFSTSTATAFASAGVDVFAALRAEPMRIIARLLEETGAAWFDVLPSTHVDELALGAFSWLLLLLGLLPMGRRSAQARQQAAQWWSCLWFGLLVMVLLGIRYEWQPPVGSTREAGYGVFLIPVGAAGILAARFGTQALAWAAAFGVFSVLAVQDWYLGLEDLRLAHMRVAHSRANLVLTDGFEDSVFGSQLVRDRLAAAGKIPETSVVQLPNALAKAFAAVPRAELGALQAGGRSRDLRGWVRSSLRNETAVWVAVVQRVDSSNLQLLASMYPDFQNNGRAVVWRASAKAALVEGARVCAVAFVPGEMAFVRLAGRFVVRNGVLVTETKS